MRNKVQSSSQANFGEGVNSIRHLVFNMGILVDNIVPGQKPGVTPSQLYLYGATLGKLKEWREHPNLKNYSRTIPHFIEVYDRLIKVMGSYGVTPQPITETEDANTTLVDLVTREQTGSPP